MKFEEILLNYENIIFDCDGVILDSNEIKTDAFVKLFEHYPKNKISQLIKYHKKHGGVSRYEKILYFFNIILEKNISEIEINLLAKRYSEISLENVKKSNFIPGLLDLLIFLKNNKKKLFVVSGSDEKDLKKIMKHKKINKYFHKIKGSPKNKSDNLTELITNFTERKNSVYIGDSEHDFKISKSLGFEFIFISGYSEWEVNKDFLFKNQILNSKDFIHR